MSETGWEGQPVSFFNRLRGYSGGFVRVEYAADAEGFTLADREKIVSKFTTFDGVNDKRFDQLNHLNLAYFPMDNCGYIWQGY